MEEGLITPTEQRSLVERVFAGDRSAEDELVQWFHGRVFAMLVSRTGDRESARDIAQDAMIAVLRALRAGSLEDPERLAQFVHGVARNLANNYFRAQSVRRPREVSLDPEQADRIQAPVQRAAAEEEALREGVEQALNLLDAGDREILLMTMEGRKPRDIARILALSSDVVRQRKCRAIQRIREGVGKMSQSGPIRHIAGGKGPA